MRIYTKGGDQGQTGLFGGKRVPKSDARVKAYGDVDELNAVIGLCRAASSSSGLALPHEVSEMLAQLQDQLFTVGSELATPEPEKARMALPTVQPEWAEAMEKLMDLIDAEVPPLREFILPGGTAAAAQLHVARTVCRRAERSAVELAEQDPEVPRRILIYLNRLSDLLFMMARLTNHRAGVTDVAWRKPDEPAKKDG
jgi:cob(I)alamin adenosyltransferase